jgi:glyoxylase-like metal-dependent hydrolase (beta-lactamase superfamily II)
MTTYLAQLERLAKLDAAVALPAHGEPIETPANLFRHYVAHRLLREGKVVAALETFAERGATASELVSTAYADTPPHVWPIAMISVEAHLEKLVEEGRAILRENRYHRALP